VWLAALLAVTTASLLVVGYVAIQAWTRGTNLLIRQRSTETLSLLGAALHRDMEGAWKGLLVPLSLAALDEDPPYDLYEPVARSFARFPYLESFLAWRAGPDGGTTYVFNRTERRPSWAAEYPESGPFPVALIPAPPSISKVVETLRDAARGRVVIYRDVTLGGVPYQVIGQILYSDSLHHNVVGLGAITINRDWVRREYFGPLVSETVRLARNEGAIAVTINDDHGAEVARVGQPVEGTSRDTRHFALLFMDPALIPRPAADDGIVEWSVSVAPAADDTLSSALTNARRTFILLVTSAGACMLALLLTVRAVRSSAATAAMQSEFVASVTHELKTPLVVVRLVGDTLAGGRYSSVDSIREYAGMLSQEAARLSRTFDRLLAYVRQGHGQNKDRVTQVTDVHDLVEAALEEFGPVLERKGFEVEVDVPRDLPRVVVERDAVIQAIEAIVDNAIKYSGPAQKLRVTGRAARQKVAVVISDRGIGIDPSDLPHVLNRFYRGRNTQERGSGLGLAIAARVMKAQGGAIDISSVPNEGTHVTLTFRASD
jgi:signal transduction histidine kinase